MERASATRKTKEQRKKKTESQGADLRRRLLELPQHHLQPLLDALQPTETRPRQPASSFSARSQRRETWMQTRAPSSLWVPPSSRARPSFLRSDAIAYDRRDARRSVGHPAPVPSIPPWIWTPGESCVGVIGVAEREQHTHRTAGRAGFHKVVPALLCTCMHAHTHTRT
eukprot:381293-Rhodomonas_salina.2